MSSPCYIIERVSPYGGGGCGQVAEARLDAPVDNSDIFYTMTAIDTDSKMIAAPCDVNVFSTLQIFHEFHPLLVKTRTYNTSGSSRNHTFLCTFVQSKSLYLSA